MTFSDAVRTCIQKYITIDGRARPAEYWWFFLFGIAGGFVAGFLDAIAFGTEGNVSPLNALFSIFIFLPSLAVGVRRLHDRDMSGWWYLLIFLPLLGILILLVMFALSGTEGRNRFGPDPLRGGDGPVDAQDDPDDYTPSSIPRVDRE